MILGGLGFKYNTYYSHMGMITENFLSFFLLGI